MKYGYRVIYRKGTKMKDRLFDHEKDARAFILKCKRYGDAYQFERYSRISFWERLLKTRIYWFRWRFDTIDILWILLILACGIYTYDIVRTLR